MPDSGTPSPGKPPYKPTLGDQHWRALLRHKKPDDVAHDMAEAIEKNDRWRFSLLLELNIDWARRDELLRRTIEFGRMDMFEALIVKDPGWHTTANVQSLAGYAAEKGRLDFVTLFVEKHKADIHHYNDELLRTAAKNGNEELVGYLLSKGADHSAWGGDPLRNACEGGHLGAVKKLVEAGANVNSGNPLDHAVMNGKTAIVEYLLSKGATVGTGYNDPFTTACRYGHADIVALLLKNGSSATANDGEAFTAACENKFFDVALVLLQHGADVNAQQGRPLRLAALRGEVETVKFLLENNANPNISSQYRETPLAEAVKSGKRETVDLLLRSGADPAFLEFEAWRVARREKKRDLQHMLIDGARAARTKEQDDRLKEFATAFSGGYTLDDLRSKKGPSGDTGLLLAARSGRFASLVGAAKEGQLLPEDLFHPDDRLDSVMSALVRTKTLQQFFTPSFWTDRTGAVMDAYESMPGQFQKRVRLDSIRAQINHRAIMKKAQQGGGMNGRLKPPKISGH